MCSGRNGGECGGAQAGTLGGTRSYDRHAKRVRVDLQPQVAPRAATGRDDRPDRPSREHRVYQATVGRAHALEDSANRGAHLSFVRRERRTRYPAIFRHLGRKREQFLDASATTVFALILFELSRALGIERQTIKGPTIDVWSVVRSVDRFDLIDQHERGEHGAGRNAEVSQTAEA